MSDGSLTPVAERLGIEADRLTALATYDDAHLTQLDDVLRTAFEHEDRAFDEALEEALRFIPRLLRGTAAKLLFPGGERG